MIQTKELVSVNHTFPASIRANKIKALALANRGNDYEGIFYCGNGHRYCNETERVSPSGYVEFRKCMTVQSLMNSGADFEF